MVRTGRIAGAYLLLGVFAIAVTLAWRGSSPLVHPDPWLKLPPSPRYGYSIMLGLSFGALVVMLTRFAVPRFGWAKTLHTALRPFARGMATTDIALLALLSGFGEELLFRGLLQPEVGLLPQALLFGIVHQLPGPSRWVWVLWATLMGLVLGAVFQLTGSLLGPLGAHALVNGLNLAYLRAHDPERRRTLGGLLGEQPNP